MARYAEYDLLSTRLAGQLQMGANVGLFEDEDVANAVKATQTLTSDATAPSDGDTVTIGDTVYTFKTSLTPTAFEVLIGASAAAALDNLKSAINATAGAGTTYATGTTAHPSVIATTNTNTTQVIEAIAYGTDGNSIATTETSTHLSWGAATMAGGANQTSATVQADIRANTPYPDYETLRERVARGIQTGVAIGDLTTATLTADDTAAEVIARFNDVSGKTDLCSL